MSFEKLKELDLTRDEVDRITEALKKEEFRKMLADYVQEIQDPDNQRLYEEEIAQLERDRGNDVVFIHPKPGYVIKTSIGGEQKCFVNVCTNELVDRPSSQPAVKEGSRGLQWSLPHSVSPAREDLDNKNARCVVYDVVFHPDTLYLAEKNKAFRNMVNTTAVQAVEGGFDVKLDGRNLKFPKLQYKGVPKATIRRTPSRNPEVLERAPEEREVFDKLYASMDNQTPARKPRPPKKCQEEKSAYTTPKYTIKHRNIADLQDCVEHKDSKLNAAIPRQLVIEVNLPLLKSAGDIQLDVAERTVELISEKPAKYRLNVTLPYAVSEAGGSAKFDKEQKKLIVALPVKRNPGFAPSRIEDSGLDSSPTSEEEEESDRELITELDGSDNPWPGSEPIVQPPVRSAFLDDGGYYTLPEFSCHLYNNTISFTLNVKNVGENSIERIIEEHSVQIKFNSISTSYFPSYYAFSVGLEEHSIEDVSVETWDNNVVVQIAFDGDPKSLTSYFYGTSTLDWQERKLQNASILAPNPDDNDDNNDEREQEVSVDVLREDNNIVEQSEAIDIAPAVCYSSGDEFSCNSCSPTKCKGILKRCNLKRPAVIRSISESSLDDYVSSSFDNCGTSLDSAIPEDGEVSTSLKKTVRFSEHIRKQLYRSNSSILGQKKKNQRKARNKKRASERRHSESELSEAEKEGDTQTGAREAHCNPDCDTDGSEKSSQADIFHLEMH